MSKLVILLAITLLALHYTSAAHTRRRRDADEESDDQDSGIVAMATRGLDLAENIPGAGLVIGFLRGWIADTFNAVQDLTNGGFGRVVGGSLPCKITEEDWITCSGVPEEGNFAPLIMGIVKQGPLPNVLQSVIEFVLTSIAEPALNTILGGVTVPPS